LLRNRVGGIVAAVVIFFKNIVLLTVLVLASPRAFAHGDVHDRINLLSANIAKAPRNASLFFQRAELYRIDQDFTNALVDLDKALQLDPTMARAEFCRGRVQFEANRPQEALLSLNKYLAGKPRDVEAYTTRARVLMKLGSYQASAEDYTTAIGISTAGPELYIERADAWRAMGKTEEAIRSLDEGIRKMGPLVTLQLPAIDLEVSAKRYDAAIARVDAVAARLQRKETWLFRRAEVLRQAGREPEAKANYRDALAALDRLPPTHRRTRATLDLESRIRTALSTNGTVSATRAL
jgi:tetratricopeptide (TPR) repeat protein